MSEVIKIEGDTPAEYAEATAAAYHAIERMGLSTDDLWDGDFHGDAWRFGRPIKAGVLWGPLPEAGIADHLSAIAGVLDKF